jgi:hypothetical protein
MLKKEGLQKLNPRSVYIILVCFLLLLFALGTAFRPKQNIDRIPEEGSSRDYKIEANIENGKDLLYALGGLNRYGSLAADLKFYANNSYKQYADVKKVVGFEVKNALKNDGDTITFEGNFGSVGNKITVQVTLLNNQRLKTSITDQKTKKSIDDKLPSNSKRNKYIATLPIQTQDFDISYDQTTEQFVATVYERSISAQNKAASTLKTALGDEQFKNEAIQYILPAPNIDSLSNLGGDQ